MINMIIDITKTWDTPIWNMIGYSTGNAIDILTIGDFVET
jgi:hypothetical protein